MRLFCWNVNGLVPTVRNVDLKHGSLAAWFAHLDADIVCIQEVKLHDSKLTKDLVVVEGYQSYWACSQGKTGYSGVTTWVRHGFAASSAEADPLSCEACDKEGRALMTDHGAFVLFNVYVPNAGVCPERARLGAKLSFLAALREKVDGLLAAGRQVILVGDFNIAAERRDVHEAINWDRLYHPSELQALQAITGQQGCNCTDTWRHLHPDTQDVYTVWQERTSSRAFNVGLRIDYALVSSGLLGKVQSCDILMDLPPKWSDHAPLLLTMSDLTAPYAAHTPSTAAAAGTAATTTPTAQQAADQHQQGPQQQQQQLPPPPECPMWQQLLRRFQDPSQRSIASMFRAAGKPKPTAKQKPGGAPPAAAAAGGNATAAAAASESAAALGHTDGSSAPAAAGLPGEGGTASQRVPGNSQHADRIGTVGGSQGSAAEGSQDMQTDAQGAAAAAALGVGTAGQHAGELPQPSANGALQLEDKQHQQQQQQHSHTLQQQPQQQQQQQPGQQSKVRGKPGSPGSSRQLAAGNKRKAASKAASKAAAATDPKQPKLHAFFARATSGDA